VNARLGFIVVIRWRGGVSESRASIYREWDSGRGGRGGGIVFSFSKEHLNNFSDWIGSGGVGQLSGQVRNVSGAIGLEWNGNVNYFLWGRNRKRNGGVRSWEGGQGSLRWGAMSEILDHGGDGCVPVCCSSNDHGCVLCSSGHPVSLRGS
jgi:hypothetical protein